MQIMEDNSESLTPPSSPIFGYSGGFTSSKDSESGIVYCFNCKGPPRFGDMSFSSEGLLLRRQLISAIETLKSSTHLSLDQKKILYQFFGRRRFDPFDIDQLKQIILLCRKQFTTLDVLSQPAYDKNMMGCNSLDPWIIRKDICQFMKFVVTHRRLFKTDQLETIFKGLVKSLATVEHWSASLKGHCGFRDGNKCISPSYHFFHTNLELRWYILQLLGLKPSIIDWVLDDLIRLAWFKYTVDNDSDFKDKQPFNCCCVRELWTMIRLLLDNIRPTERGFWNFFHDAFNRMSSIIQGDSLFSLWLVVNIAPLSSYTLSGIYKNQDHVCGSDQAWPVVSTILSSWSTRGGRTNDMIGMVNQLLPLWGFDLESLLTFWNHWLPRLDRNTEVSNLDSFTSIEKWFRLVHIISSQDSSDNISQSAKSLFSSDTFLSFVQLLSSCIRACQNPKDWRKINSSICSKLTPKTVGDFGEVGLLRVSTLYLIMSYSGTDSLSMCERLTETLQYGKQTSARKKTILRAFSVALLVLLKKSIDISDVCVPFMSIINELLTSGANDSQKKEFVMVYLELLDNIAPPNTPSWCEVNLGRQNLISPNLTIWLSYCGPNYLIRTLRPLGALTKSTNSNSMVVSYEKDELQQAIFNRTAPFLQEAVTARVNRVGQIATDLTPLAILASDLTLFCWRKSDNIYTHYFDRFALHEQCPPEICGVFLERLLDDDDFADHGQRDIKWLQGWVRLIALDASVPGNLTRKVVPNMSSSLRPREAYQYFCERESSNFPVSELQIILSPIIDLLKSVINGSLKDVMLTRTIIQTSCVSLRRMKFESVYVKGKTTSFGHEVMQALILTMSQMTFWDKLPLPNSVVEALEDHLYDIFVSIVLSNGLSNDTFLQRKARETALFSMLAYLKAGNVLEENHPGLRIMQFAVGTNNAFALNDVIPFVSTQCTRDARLFQRFLLIVSGFQCKALSSIVVRLLPGVLSIYTSNKTNTQEMLTSCVKIILYSCSFPALKGDVLRWFEVEMEQNFGFRSRRFYDLFNLLVRSSRKVIKEFLVLDLIPMIKHQVELCEMKRGIGEDRTLRQPLEKLIRDAETMHPER